VVIGGAGMADTVSPPPTRTSSSNALAAMAPPRGNRLLHPALWELGQLLQRVLRISVIVVVTLVLVLWDRRTGKVIIGQTLAVLVALDH
jgi:hypothetical protein